MSKVELFKDLNVTGGKTTKNVPHQKWVLPGIPYQKQRRQWAVIVDITTNKVSFSLECLFLHIVGEIPQWLVTIITRNDPKILNIDTKKGNNEILTSSVQSISQSIPDRNVPKCTQVLINYINSFSKIKLIYLYLYTL